MKNLKITIAALAAMTLCLVSCNKNNSGTLTEAIVTVKTAAASGECYLQLNETTTLKPTNWTASPYGTTPTRAHIIYTDTGKNKDGYDRNVTVNASEKILTKTTVATKGSTIQDVLAYGNSPVGICYNWATNIEDGYLTLNFAGFWGWTGIVHTLNLVTGTDSSDPYKLVFRHNANGDTSTARLVYGLVAFDLSSLPDTEGKTVNLTLSYTYLDGTTHTTVFPYCTKGTSSPNTSETNAYQVNSEINVQ